MMQDLQKRHWSRRFALQALYQWQIAQHSTEELLSQYLDDENWPKVDKDYFVELLSETINKNEQLIEELSRHSDTPIEQVDPIEKAILLFSTYELMHKPEVPVKVILSESVKLAKKFGSIEGYKFINGVLDKLSAIRN